jgi:hypothetical protein
MIRKTLIDASLLTACCAAVSYSAACAQVVAPSTWATGIVIEPQPRNPDGTPILPPSAAAFDDWDAIPLAVSDPADNPDPLNLIDIKDVKIANDADFIYIYASGHEMRTNGVYLAFDTDNDINTGYNIFGLFLVGSEIGYVNDFPFDQRSPGVFNDNKNTAGEPDPGGSCCTGGPLDINNAGAAMYPGWDVEFGEREWAISLDALWSVNEPTGPVFPNATFSFILWTDQGDLDDVTDTITYTLAEPPNVPGDFDHDVDVDGADFILWQRELGGTLTAGDLALWTANFGATSVGASAVPEPATAAPAVIGLVMAALVGRSTKRSR